MHVSCIHIFFIMYFTQQVILIVVILCNLTLKVLTQQSHQLKQLSLLPTILAIMMVMYTQQDHQRVTPI